MKKYTKPEVKTVDTTIEVPFALGGGNTVGGDAQGKGTNDFEEEEYADEDGFGW